VNAEAYAKRKQNWSGVRIPNKLCDSIDEFLKTDIAKKQGLFSRSDFIVRIAISWFAQYDRDYRLFMTASRSPMPPPTTWKEGPKRFERQISEQLEITKQELLRMKQTEEEEEERRREEIVRMPDFIDKFINELPQDKREEFYRRIAQRQKEQEQEQK
jgi:hypothetical protein